MDEGRPLFQFTMDDGRPLHSDDGRKSYRLFVLRLSSLALSSLDPPRPSSFTKHQLRREDGPCPLQVALDRFVIVYCKVDFLRDLFFSRFAGFCGPLPVALGVAVAVFDPVIEHGLQFPERVGPFLFVLATVRMTV